MPLLPYHRCLVAFVLLVALPGCASLSQSQCLTSDWHAIGRQDGANGLTRARLADHRQACAEYGVRPDPAAYEAGRRQGLVRYCTPDRGFREGREGHRYRNVCPPHAERGFLAGYRSGRILHDAQEALDDVRRDINIRENKLDDDDITKKERTRLLRELDQLHRHYRRLERELIHLRHIHAAPGSPYR